MNAADAAEYRHLLAKCREAQAGGWRVLSTGEKLAAALVLNRADWLQDAGYSMAEAIERVGCVWVALVPAVARELLDGAPQPGEPPAETDADRLAHEIAGYTRL